MEWYKKILKSQNERNQAEKPSDFLVSADSPIRLADIKNKNLPEFLLWIGGPQFL